MGWHLEQKSRKQQSWISSSSLGSLVCLVTLLVHLSLPSVHQYEHILEGFIVSAAGGDEKRSEFQLGAAESQHRDHSHHDAATCSICQAASLCRYFSAPTLCLSPISALPVQRFWDRAFTSIVADVNLLTSGPRAPPASFYLAILPKPFL
jgi:hypothetical protein